MDQVHWDRKCGFVGPGSQGAPMARRMVNAGMHVVFWARRPQSLVPYRVANDADVKHVCGELLPAMRPGALIAIHATVHPDTRRVLAEEASRP